MSTTIPIYLSSVGFGIAKNCHFPTTCEIKFQLWHIPSNNIPFFLSSGLPFFTVAITMSPLPAAGSLLRRPRMPCTDIMYRFFAPVWHNAATPITVVWLSQITKTKPLSLFTAQCTIVQSAVMRSHVVWLTVTLVDHDHIGWKSWKLIAWTISPTSLLFVAQRSSTYSLGNMEKFWGENVQLNWLKFNRESRDFRWCGCWLFVYLCHCTARSCLQLHSFLVN